MGNIKGKLLSEMLKIPLPCNGRGVCGKCKVAVSANGGLISEITAEEKRLLTAEEIASGVRLACKTYAIGDIGEVFATPLYAEDSMEIVTAGIAPSFELAAKEGGLGVAIDIGTTTIVAALYDLKTGEHLCTKSEKNPQVIFGADVISRIEASLSGKKDELKQLVTACVDSLISQLGGEEADSVIITGNTAMMFLLTGTDVKCLSAAPFEASTLFGEKYDGRYLAPCISAFVGGDITTAILGSDLLKKGTAILVDIGTNGEMALSNDGKLFCCSTAAGPCFEGGSLSHGMTASSGAIDHVFFENGEISFSTIVGAPAVGICGSGIIDAVACLLKCGKLDETGAFIDGSDYVFEGTGVAITAKDIRAIQLSKAAICAGILSLVNAAELEISDISALLIAGGFGSFINIENAAAIGLIPRELLGKAVAVGNSALVGATMLLLGNYAEKARKIASSAQLVDLSTSSDFMENYVDCMMFAVE